MPLPEGGAAQVVIDEATFILPLEGVIDIAAEQARLAKAAEAAEKERDSLAARLGNPSFVEKRQARGGREGARRSCREGVGRGEISRGAGPAWLMAAGRGQRDLTSGPIGWTLLAFAFPTFVSTVLQSLNGSVNAVWIGRTLGEEALAATSNANLVMFLLAAFVFGFGMAATVLVGQAFGRGDVIEARRVVGTAIGGFMPLAIAIGVIGWLGAPALLHLLSTPADALPLAVAYLRVVFVALPAVLVIIVLMMALRGSGDAMTPLWFMLLVVFLDSALNPVFILGLGPAPELGIAGSATATVIANYLGLAGLLFYIYRRDLPLRLRGRRAALPARRSGPAPNHLQEGPADGDADGRRLLLGAGDPGAGQSRGRRYRRRLWRRHAALDLSPDAGDGARRRGQRHGRAEYRGGQVGPGRRGDARRHRLQLPHHPAAARPARCLPTGRPWPCSWAAPARRCRSPSMSSCSLRGASCCSA